MTWTLRPGPHPQMGPARPTDENTLAGRKVIEHQMDPSVVLVTSCAVHLAPGMARALRHNVLMLNELTYEVRARPLESYPLAWTISGDKVPVGQALEEAQLLLAAAAAGDGSAEHLAVALYVQRRRHQEMVELLDKTGAALEGVRVLLRARGDLA